MAWAMVVTLLSANRHTAISANPRSMAFRLPMRLPMKPAGSAPITPPTAHAIMPMVTSSGRRPNRSVPCSENHVVKV